MPEVVTAATSRHHPSTPNSTLPPFPETISPPADCPPCDSILNLCVAKGLFLKPPEDGVTGNTVQWHLADQQRANEQLSMEFTVVPNKVPDHLLLGSPCAPSQRETHMLLLQTPKATCTQPRAAGLS